MRLFFKVSNYCVTIFNSSSDIMAKIQQSEPLMPSENPVPIVIMVAFGVMLTIVVGFWLSHSVR